MLWVLCADWVFQWHHWFLPQVSYPCSDFGRFGILIAVAVLGWVPAALLRKGLRGFGGHSK